MIKLSFFDLRRFPNLAFHFWISNPDEYARLLIGAGRRGCRHFNRSLNQLERHRLRGERPYGAPGAHPLERKRSAVIVLLQKGVRSAAAPFVEGDLCLRGCFSYRCLKLFQSGCVVNCVHRLILVNDRSTSELQRERNLLEMEYQLLFYLTRRQRIRRRASSMLTS